METINQRLQYLVDTLSHGNGALFCQQTGIGYMTFKNYVGGRFSKPSSDSLESIAISFPQVSLRWLLTGEGAPFEDGEKKKGPVGDEGEGLLDEVLMLRKKVAKFEQVAEQLNLLVAIQHATGAERDSLRGRLKKYDGAPKKRAGQTVEQALRLF